MRCQRSHYWVDVDRINILVGANVDIDIVLMTVMTRVTKQVVYHLLSRLITYPLQKIQTLEPLT